MDFAKSHGLSSTELQLRTVLLQRMAGQPRDIIDTAIQTTKLVTAFLLHEGHKSLEDLLDEVRTSPELMAEYRSMDQGEEGGVERTSSPSSEASSSEAGGTDSLPPDDEPSTSQTVTDNTSSSNDAKGLIYSSLNILQKSSMEKFRKFVFNKVMERSDIWERGWKSSQYQRCCTVLLKAGLTVLDLAEYNKQAGRVDAELTSTVKPIFNREGPINIGFDNYKTWLNEFLDREGKLLILDQVTQRARAGARLNMNTGIPKSHLSRRIVLGLPKKKKKKKSKK